MAVTDAEVKAWLASNPGATDTQIRQAMDKYGVTSTQLARVTGLKPTEVQSRYAAADPNMLFRQLNSGAMHQQIIDAYNQWVATQGGSSQATLNEAGNYLRNLGISNDVINQSGARYVNAPNLGSLAGSIAQQVQAGNNLGAYTTYQQLVNQYGFTPKEFSKALGGQFTPQQISQWAAQGAAGAFSQPQQPTGGMMTGPSFNYGDSYWNQVGGSYQNMFGSQQGLHVPELKEWYANQGWSPNKPVAQAAPVTGGMLTQGQTKPSYITNTDSN